MPASNASCVVIKTGQCVDISARCKDKNCPGDKTCVVDGDNNIKCITKSKYNAFCPPSLDQPCPADADVIGFDMNCSYCESSSFPSSGKQAVRSSGAQWVQGSGKTNLGVAGERSIDQGDFDRSEAENADWLLASRVHPTIAW